jgi:non-ribosomal peptide synthase protein (TIGR01720 family)
LENLYRSNLAAPLPLKTTSFKEWSEKLHGFAKEKLDLRYWKEMNPAQFQSLTKAKVTDNYLKDHTERLIVLGEAATKQLLTEVNWAYNTEINDILLTALTLALTDALKTEQILVNLEGHGREELFEDVDITRTVGWFTCAYPVSLQRCDEIKKTVKTIKEHLRMIPNKGINYGIGCYLQQEPELKKIQPEISFNYLGQFDGVVGKDGMGNDRLLYTCEEEAGSSLHPENQHAYLVDFNGMVIDGKLQIKMSYNPLYLAEELADIIQQKYKVELESLIAHCASQSSQDLTASDFGAEDKFDQDGFGDLADLYEF